VVVYTRGSGDPDVQHDRFATMLKTKLYKEVSFDGDTTRKHCSCVQLQMSEAILSPRNDDDAKSDHDASMPSTLTTVAFVRSRNRSNWLEKVPVGF